MKDIQNKMLVDRDCIAAGLSSACALVLCLLWFVVVSYVLHVAMDCRCRLTSVFCSTIHTMPVFAFTATVGGIPIRISSRHLICYHTCRSCAIPSGGSPYHCNNYDNQAQQIDKCAHIVVFCVLRFTIVSVMLLRIPIF